MAYPIGRHSAGKGRLNNRWYGGLEADLLPDQDDRAAGGVVLALQHEQPADERLEAQVAEPVVLPRVGVGADAAEGGVEVRHDLLPADDPERLLGAGRVQPELAAGGRGDDHDPVLGDGVDAADDDLRGGPHGDLPADVLRVDVREPAAHGDELLAVVDVSEQARVPQRLAGAGEDRLVAREQVADEHAGVGDSVDDMGGEPALAQALRRAAERLVVGHGGERVVDRERFDGHGSPSAVSSYW